MTTLTEQPAQDKRPGRAARRRRRRAYLCWALVVVAGLVAVVPLFARLSNGTVAGGTQSARVQNLIDHHGPSSGQDYVVLRGPVSRPGLAAQVATAVAAMRNTAGVASVRTCYDSDHRCSASSSFRARGAPGSLILVTFARNASGSPAPAALDAVQTAAGTITKARVQLGGDDYLGLTGTALAESDMIRGELTGLAAALVILWLLFGFRGALIPLLGGIVTFSGHSSCCSR